MLPRTFYAIDAATLAQRLLGCVLVRSLGDGTRLGGVIVETEAYVGVKDRASHAFGGRRTPRNESMYGPPGTAYVYFTYGMHFCFNVVCATEGDPQAVLVRAIEPLEGLEAMRANRGGGDRVVRDAALCSGPAKLCQALKIDRRMDGHDLVSGAEGGLWIDAPPDASGTGRGVGSRGTRVMRSSRIGVGYAGAWAGRRLRWFVVGNPHVSGARLVSPARGRSRAKGGGRARGAGRNQV